MPPPANEPVTTPTYPAAYPGVVAVTATDSTGQIASYANRGSFVDLAISGDTSSTTTTKVGSSKAPPPPPPSPAAWPPASPTALAEMRPRAQARRRLLVLEFSRVWRPLAKAYIGTRSRLLPGWARQ